MTDSEMDNLVLSHLNMTSAVFSKIAAKYGDAARRHYDDLISCGYMSLVRCARSYNKDVARFSTYAYTAIMNSMTRYMDKEMAYRQSPLMGEYLKEAATPHDTYTDIPRGVLLFPYNLFEFTRAIKDVCSMLEPLGIGKNTVIRMVKELRRLEIAKEAAHDA